MQPVREIKETHQLLLPRWLQLVDFPGQQASKGTVYYMSTKEPVNLDAFPEVFRKLEWWEYRPPEVLPEFCMWGKEPVDVEWWEWWEWRENVWAAKVVGRVKPISAKVLTPLTEEEYVKATKVADESWPAGLAADPDPESATREENSEGSSREGTE